MRDRVIHAVVALIAFAGLSLTLVALTWQSAPPLVAAAEDEHADEESDQEHAEHEPTVERHGDDQHEADASGERQGLDDLMKIECEHGGPIIHCNECRYEAGVARIEPALARELVETHVVGSERRTTAVLELTGEVALDLTRVVEIAAAGSGRVEQVSKILGDVVRASDVLAVVQSSEFGQAQAAFLEARARLDLAEQTYAREEQLHAQQISSRADYLAAQNDLVAARAAVAATRKRLYLFGLTEQQIEAFAQADPNVPIGRLVLRTPIDGVVVEQDVVRGRVVDPAETLFRIADLSRVWVWCDAYESDLAALYASIGSDRPAEAQIRVRAFPQSVFAGTVDRIGSELDHRTRTLKVRLVAANPDGRLTPGMFVKAAIDLAGSDRVSVVPETAVLSDAGQHFVFARLNEELWIRRDVTVGPALDGRVAVHAGLRDGDVIAARGAFMFKSEVLKEKMGAGCAH